MTRLFFKQSSNAFLKDKWFFKQNQTIVPYEHKKTILLLIHDYLVKKTFLGTSGWSYDEWVGPVYPNSRTPKLKYYSLIFDTVEIDSTFYAYPKKEMVTGWIRNTPVGFRFSAKLPQSSLKSQHYLLVTSSRICQSVLAVNLAKEE